MIRGLVFNQFRESWLRCFLVRIPPSTAIRKRVIQRKGDTNLEKNAAVDFFHHVDKGCFDLQIGVDIVDHSIGI
jgi:hypothetical protein